MKVTLNWLKQYVDIDDSPEALAERLTMTGMEVEAFHKIGGEFDGIIVARVLSRDPHPNADKLSLCRVEDGRGERQIVCGAQNFQAGDKVPLILPGHSLPTKAGDPPFTIKVGKIRGVESQGMLCSPKELGLSDDAQGLLILPADARVGQPFAEHLGRAGSDVLYDLEITPNRPDLNSVIGIAREISAATGNPLKLPAIQFLDTSSEPVRGVVDVRIEEPALCGRYVARVLRNVKVGPSPDWLRHLLEQVGLRSINNVVDVTNYVLLETGQPLHAFDYHLLARPSETSPKPPTIVVRRARDGEKFVTLDGEERALTGDMLLIADELKPVALAGVMGGRNSEINERTSDVLIESAWFESRNIRATSKRLGLRTDASYRYERGADIGICDWASRRAAQLMAELAGGQLISEAIDAHPGAAQPREIPLRFHKTDQLLGVPIPSAEQTAHLQRLGIDPVQQGADSATFRIPTFRVDLKRETDLIEEICRLHGVDRIPATPPRGAIGSHPHDAVHDQLAEARRLLTGLGLDEAQGQTLISDTAARLISGEFITLDNPLSSDMNVLRPGLLPGLLDALSHNLSRKIHDVALFEIGRVFIRKENQPVESRCIALAMTGRRNPAFWSGTEGDARFDLHDLKGVLEEFFQQFGVRGLVYTRRDEATALFVESASIQLGRQEIGQMGQLLPPLARKLDLRDAVLLAELDLDLLLARRNVGRSFKPLPAFPSIRRDIAMILPEATTHDTVLMAVKKAKPAHLEQVDLFDVFRGDNVPQGRKSMAYAFTYRSPERTLTDAEVNKAHEALVKRLKDELNAVIRDS